MFDDDKLFKNRANRKILNGEARLILEMLGFSSVELFSAQSGLHPETVSQILGLRKLKHRKQGFVVASIHTALHTAYMEKREELSKTTRAFICDWANRWKQQTLDERVWVESPGKIKHDNPDPVVLKDRLRKRKKSKAATAAELGALEWTV